MLKAIGYRVLIKPDEVVDETESGIILTLDDKAERAAMQTGTVVDIGPVAFKDYAKDYSDGNWISVGDRVVYSKYGGKWLYDFANFDPLNPSECESFVIVDDADILCRVEDN